MVNIENIPSRKRRSPRKRPRVVETPTPTPANTPSKKSSRENILATPSPEPPSKRKKIAQTPKTEEDFIRTNDKLIKNTGKLINAHKKMIETTSEEKRTLFENSTRLIENNQHLLSKNEKFLKSGQSKRKHSLMDDMDQQVVSASKFQRDMSDDDSSMGDGDMDKKMREMGVIEEDADPQSFDKLRHQNLTKRRNVDQDDSSSSDESSDEHPMQTMEYDLSKRVTNNDLSDSDDDDMSEEAPDFSYEPRGGETSSDEDSDEPRVNSENLNLKKGSNQLPSDDDEFNIDEPLLGGESDSDEDEDDELQRMVKESKAIREEREKQRQEAQQELHEVDTSIDKDLLDRLQQGEEEDKEEKPEDALFQAEDISQIYSRIAENLRVLTNFKQFKEEGYTREDYLNLLKEDLVKYYGYLPDLIDIFSKMFSPAEMIELLESNEAPRPVVLRTNPLKVRRREVAEALIKRGVSLDTLDRWSNLGLKVSDSKVPVGATPEYLAGHYMIQGASSFLPVISLDPQPYETIVDMASAPGGKTTYVSALMKNTGVLYANDPERKRIKGLIANIHRLGCRNTIVCNHDGRDLPQVIKKRADRVLLDAPCSGTGVVSRDPSVKTSRDYKDVRKMSRIQKELLLAAIDVAKDPKKNKGKPVYIVYSTCSVTTEENEEVVQYALKKRHVRIVETNLPKKLGRPGFKRVFTKRFDPRMEHCRRVYPHTNNMDGFFICKLEKLSDGPREERERKRLESKLNKKTEERKQQKEENIRKQKAREVANRQLFQQAVQRLGSESAARDYMRHRVDRKLSDPEHRTFRPKRTRSKWR